MREKTITLALFEKYSPEEMTTVAQKMAQAQADLESVEVEKRVSDAAFNERLKKLYAEVSEHAKRYNKGGETAQIGCDIRYDHPEPGKKSYFRMDRNELVETHDMSWEEKQETIQFPLAESAPEPTVSDISAASLEKLAEEPAPAPEKCQEEVTQICPFPGCTLFADHDGDHELKPDPHWSNPDQNCPACGLKSQAVHPCPHDFHKGQPIPQGPINTEKRKKLRAILPDPRKPTGPPAGGVQP